MAERERVGLVLAGGGARGAYEAGALSVLGPELRRLGHRPTMFVGTSVGAKNAAGWAAARHLDAEEAATRGLEAWRAVGRDRIIRSCLLRQLPLAVASSLGRLLPVSSSHQIALFDPQPIERALQDWVDLDDAHQNVSTGTADALAIAATTARTGRTVVFVDTQQALPPHQSHALDYVRTPIERTHLLASAAIPVLFPAVEVPNPPEAQGWYVDGGTRLNAPIKPALDLGADRLVVIATDAISQRQPAPELAASRPPDVFDGALHLMEGALSDPLTEDIITLGNVNHFFAGTTAPRAARYRRTRGKPPYRTVPYLYVAPERRGALGELASDVLHSRHRGITSLRSPLRLLLRHLVSADSPAHGELLSYLFFDPDFIDELIHRGQQDARRALEAQPHPDSPWRIGPPGTLTATPRHDAETVRPPR
ncbi:patatin-like phospholipase family protein [Haloechinothrix salitolerans]|uniref:Patatin-like phospholipase family protein n=1 Tax=Haloechinothrix salitolerans TaxID=926830 RepID=A0ABW2C5W6_9PSEU